MLIIGAGVCGLYAGLTLARGGVKVTILEKESRVGGLAAGFPFGENTCDFGVHMLHAFNKEIFEDCAELMGEERIEAALDARIRWGDSSCRYPLQFKDMLKAMPPITLGRCVLGLVIAEITGAKHKANIENAESALIAFYGAPLYEYFFEEFTHKYWGIHPRDLSAEFIRRKMPRLSAVDVLRKLIPSFKRQKANDVADVVESALDTETLHYSRTGSEALPRSLAREFERLGGAILTEARISKISPCNGEVIYSHDGEEKRFQGEHIINTAPLHYLVDFSKAEAPEKVSHAVSRLRYKPTVIFALLVNKDRCMEGLYTYYRSLCFHRVGEPKNAGLEVIPGGHTILIVESTCEVGDEKWQGSDEFYQQVLGDLAAEGICMEDEIVDKKLMRNAHGYPIFTNGFDRHLQVIMDWVDSVEKLTSTGRQGGFAYPAMHSAMQMGKDAAQHVLNKPLLISNS